MERFRGAVCLTRWQRGPFWHHLDVDASAVVFWTYLDGDVRIERKAVDRVEYERILLPPFVWRRNIRFHRVDGRWSSRFVAFRPGRLRGELERLGWPMTTVPTLSYRRLFAESFGRGWWQIRGRRV